MSLAKVKPLIFVLCLVPLALLLYQGVTGLLDPDPGKAMVLVTGLWALRFLLLTLLVTPAKQWFGFHSLAAYRRMLGLYAWFYASVHLLCVLTYLLGWNWLIFVEEFIERPYMALGIIAWCLMVPLGLTSNRWSRIKLKQRWQQLHKLVYPIALLACAHFIWLVRSDYGEALAYSLILALALLARWAYARKGALRVPAANRP